MLRPSATIQVTFDTYGHLPPGGLEKAAAATDTYLAQAKEQDGLRPVPRRTRGGGVPRGSVVKTKPRPGPYQLGRRITVIVLK